MATERVFGRHAAISALRGRRRVTRVYVAQGVEPAFAAEIGRLTGILDIPLEQVQRSFLDQRAAGTPHQGVMLDAEPLSFADLEQVLAALPAGRDAFLVALDQVQDPHNLGAIIRTAAAAGADGIVIPERRSATLGPGALKAAAGAAEWFPVSRVVNLARTLDQLKEHGLWVVGSDGEAPTEVWQADLRRPVVLVIGGEDRGLGRLIRDKCDYVVRLPMTAPTQSLNASVAAGILIYEVVRQRKMTI